MSTDLLAARRLPSSPRTAVGHRNPPGVLTMLLALVLARNVWPTWQVQLLATSLVTALIILWSPVLGRINITMHALILLLGGVGLVGLLWSTPISADVLRDLANLLRLGILCTVGVLLGRTREGLEALVRVIVVAGLVDAGAHLAQFFTAGGLGLASVNTIRTDVGKSSFVEVLALAILVLFDSSVNSRWRLKPSYRFLGIALLSLSTLLYFSRTAIGGVIVVLIFAWWLTARRDKDSRAALQNQGGVMATGAVLAVGCVALVVSFSPSPVIDEFIDKAENSIHEVIPRDATSRVEITQNYRSYESYRAIEDFRTSSVPQQIVGQGWGHRVDLVIDTASTTAGSARYSAPLLHNGYLELLLKTGVIGIAIVSVLFILGLRCAITQRRVVGVTGMLARVSFGTMLMLIGSTFVTGGILNLSNLNAAIVLVSAVMASARSTIDSQVRKEGVRD